MTVEMATRATRPGVWAPLRVCGQPGCRARQDAAYCPAHTPLPHGGLSPAARGLDAAYYRARSAVLARDNFRCQLHLRGCTTLATTADHIVPRIAGGTNDLANLRAACLHCNSARGAR